MTSQTTSAKENPDGMGDNPSNPTPEKPVDPYESLKDMECWIAGKRYTEFAYDKTDYAISFHHGDPFPEAPEMKNIPEEEGWKLESITSGAVLNQDAQRYKVTVANDTTHVSREYTFTYEREPGADNNPITQFFGGDTGGNAESTAPRRSLAATGGSLVQTGDAVLIIGGAAIALASGAWILVYGKKKSSEA